MKYSITPYSCRVCLKRSKKLRSIYKPLDEGDEAPNEMLRQLTGITINLEDNEVNSKIAALPMSICKSCDLSLNLAFQFRLKALKSQRIIDVYKRRFQPERLNGSTSSYTVVKEEIEDVLNLHESLMEQCIREEELNCSMEEMKVEELEIAVSEEESNSCDDRVEYLEDSFIDVVIGNEQSQKTDASGRQGKGAAAAATSQTDTCKAACLVTAKNVKSKLCGRKGSKRVRSIATYSGDKRSKPEVTSRKLRKPNVDVSEHNLAEVNSMQPNRLTTVTKRGRPIKKVHEESDHICDICGNIYAKRGRMMEHRRRHDTELRYACEFCDLRFLHREKLRKHMYSHSGSKPYKCSSCSRTFFYESVKKAHEAIHSGHKPYICDVCNKPFAYSQALKMHKLIHAEIKLYHCEYCNKDFRLQHHMKQHEETKLHKIAVQSAETACSKWPS